MRITINKVLEPRSGDRVYLAGAWSDDGRLLAKTEARVDATAYVVSDSDALDRRIRADLTESLQRKLQA